MKLQQLRRNANVSYVDAHRHLGGAVAECDSETALVALAKAILAKETNALEVHTAAKEDRWKETAAAAAAAAAAESEANAEADSESGSDE